MERTTTALSILMIALAAVGMLPQAHSAEGGVEGVGGSDLGEAVDPASIVTPELLAKVRTQGRVPVIVRLRVGDVPAMERTPSLIRQRQDGLLERLSHRPVRLVKKFTYVPYIAMDLDEDGLVELSVDPEVVRIQEDVPVPPSLADSVPLTRADPTTAYGLTGDRQVVAILDTGVDNTHLFLDGGQVISEACYSTTYGPHGAATVCPNGTDSQTGTGAGAPCDLAVDGCDHGTHVAGIAAGVDSTVVAHGVARDAYIIAIQVFSSFTDDPFRGITNCAANNRASPCALTYTSDQILGLERVYALRNSFRIAAVNMSLGGGRNTANCDSDSRKDIIDDLRAAGIATVIASGNDGFSNALGAPACISSAVSVGATDKADNVAWFSNSASFLSLLAPGVAISSSVPGDAFQPWDGTSMAAPHVAGAFALMKEANPSTTVSAMLTALQTTGVDIAVPGTTFDVPRIDVAAAIAQFTSTVRWTGAGHRGYGWYVGDFDGDGDEDVFRQLNRWGGAEMFLSDGTKSFDYVGRWTGAGHRGYGWYVGDFDGDGDDDIFRQLNEWGGAEVFLSNGRTGFYYAGRWTGAGHRGHRFYVGDFDGDGDDDIFRQLNQWGGAEVFLSNGRTGFYYVGRWTGAGHRGYGFYVGDFDGDGDDDIFRQMNQWGGAEVLVSNGSNAFSYTGRWTGAGHRGHGWYVGDFDGDGLDDIFRQVSKWGGAEVANSQGATQRLFDATPAQ